MTEGTRSLYLVGPAGVGKTTTGKLLAKSLGLPFFDSDAEIESRCGVRIPVIFEVEGETGFRARESEVIDELTGRPGIILSTGGGAVLRETNRERLAARGFVAYLHATPHVLYLRTKGDKSRPLLQTSDPRATIEAQYQLRDPLYRAVAHCVVDASRGTPSHAAAKVAEAFEAWRKAYP